MKSYFIPGGVDSNNVVIDHNDPFRPDFWTDDPDKFVAECKRLKIKARLTTAEMSRSPYRPTHTLKNFLTPPKASRSRELYSPEHGQIGSWVIFTFPNGERGVGQVWSEIKGGKHPIVWVADGQQFRQFFISELEPAATPYVWPTLEEEVAS